MRTCQYTAADRHIIASPLSKIAVKTIHYGWVAS